MKRKVTIVVEMDVDNEQEAKKTVIDMREEMERWAWDVKDMKLEDLACNEEDDCLFGGE